MPSKPSSRPRRWTLEDRFDFEQALAAWDGQAPDPPLPASLTRDSDRLHEWLLRFPPPAPSAGKRWIRTLGFTTVTLGFFAFLAGISAAFGSYQSRYEGIHVVIFLAVTLFIPWLVLLAGLLLWSRRRSLGSWLFPFLRFFDSFTTSTPTLAFPPADPQLRRLLGWRLAATSQYLAMHFHGGAAAGLSFLVIFRKVGFFWETTTRSLMEHFLQAVVQFLAAPWSSLAPQLLPDVTGTQRHAQWQGGGESWWLFLLLTLGLWGVTPRLLLFLFAQSREYRLLRRPDFSSPQARKLLRTLRPAVSTQPHAGPDDHALVVPLGRFPLDLPALRPFLLRQLRLSPAATAGLDELPRDLSPYAGLILVAEAWALAPRAIQAALDPILALHPRRVFLVVANVDPQGRPCPPTTEETATWEQYFDTLPAHDVELHFYRNDSPLPC